MTLITTSNDIARLFIFSRNLATDRYIAIQVKKHDLSGNKIQVPLRIFNNIPNEKPESKEIRMLYEKFSFFRISFKKLFSRKKVIVRQNCLFFEIYT